MIPIKRTLQKLDPASRRRVAAGELIGTREHGGIHAWRGIPYASPPSGPLRWRAPRPATPWSGVLEARAHGSMAPQYADLLAGVPARQRGQIAGDEDCLTLNIFAPAFEPGAVPGAGQRPPVMVWIHGGGNSVGTSATYDAARNYAIHDGLVVVTVNYRLGVLGWFTHPALHEADDVTPEERSGNFGTLDLIAALRWVQDNIAAFGGDPGCVTIFGESAGGQNVLTLLASPLAQGLFHRAIAQSPVAETFSIEQAVNWSDDAQPGHHDSAFEVTARLWVAEGRSPDREGAKKQLANLPAADIAAFLRALSPARLLKAFTPGSVGIYRSPRPVRDGVVLPREPLAEVFSCGQWNRVPVILGSNRDEFKTFSADKPEHSRLLLGKLPLLRDRRGYQVEMKYLSLAWKALFVDAPADAMLAGGHTEVWTYRFDWDEAPAVPFVRPDLLLGAAHAMEMAFVFRDTAGELDIFGVNTRFNRSGRAVLAQAMGDAWISFARKGVPTVPGHEWTRRDIAEHRPDCLVFDTARDGGIRMARLGTDMAAVKQALRTDSAADPATLRCRIYARLFLWNPLFAGHGESSEYERWCRECGCSVPAAQFRPRLEV
ncbi:carboxylesterase/lipase family protein [Variovorax fucosicus]|uniref:carboxylesterase/lipase family protein n=1 Tax=Variovorax fucosicus TaxID=3053517 RepID=UPI002576CAA5|nr:carboxylesterase family protein [Variovorax sp. J22G47]MDM0056877.1 carboxylesterase family protein [Variovorax sp. J22G47]